MSTNADLCLKPLKYTQPLDAHPYAYRDVTPGTRKALEVKLQQAKTRLKRLQSELTTKEAEKDAVKARRDALIAERAEARATTDDDIDAVAKGTASVGDVAMKQARVSVVEAALPKVGQELSNWQGVVTDANHLVRDAGREVQALESDLILLELTEGLAPLSEILKMYFEKSGDAALILRPAESPADADD
jgi:hypothetical protein